MEKRQEIETAVHNILSAIGEDPTRDGLKRTPQRVAEMFKEIFAGYDSHADELLRQSLFDVDYDEMIVVKDVEFYSMCEHHMLPFYGRAHVAYVPNDKIIGLSQIPRLVEMYARRLQIQEQLTHEIANTILSVTQAAGVAVIIEAKHLCMMMRGVQKQNSLTTTSAFTGECHQVETRNEFLNLISKKLY